MFCLDIIIENRSSKTDRIYTASICKSKLDTGKKDKPTKGKKNKEAYLLKNPCKFQIRFFIISLCKNIIGTPTI